MIFATNFVLNLIFYLQTIQTITKKGPCIILYVPYQQQNSMMPFSLYSFYKFSPQPPPLPPRSLAAFNSIPPNYYQIPKFIKFFLYNCFLYIVYCECQERELLVTFYMILLVNFFIEKCWRQLYFVIYIRKIILHF